jgi:hypothetical protein
MTLLEQVLNRKEAPNYEEIYRLKSLELKRKLSSASKQIITEKTSALEERKA